MESKFQNGTLVVKPEGKVDTSNAAAVEKEIFGLLDQYKPTKVILDAQKLEYISSVGLRVVLKLKKAVDNTLIVNASLEVYDIFDMTGFTSILEVKKALREISVEGCEIIGKGAHGTVYRLDSDTIVKLFGEKEPFDEIHREISYAKKAFVFGIPTAISYDVVRCGSCYGLVYELINADTLANRLCAHPETLDTYAVKYGNLVKSLHETEADTAIFGSTKDLYNRWVDDMAVYYTPDEIAILHQVINSVPDCNTFIHGDIHTKNVMVQDDELLLIDMADLTYGHPIFDYPSMLVSHFLPAAHAKHLIGIESDMAQKLYFSALKIGFPGKTDAQLEQIHEVIMGYAGIKFALLPALSKILDSQKIQMVIAKTREEILPNAKKLIGAVNF